MKVVLVVPPMLIRRCPLIGVGYIAAYLQARGHSVRVIDLNVTKDLPFADQESVWGHWEFAPQLAHERPELFESWVDDILRDAPSAVAFSTWVTTRSSVLLLAERIRSRGPSPWIILGGPQAGFEAAELIRMDCVDAVIPGEGEETLACLLTGAEGEDELPLVDGAVVKSCGLAKSGGDREEIRYLDSLPFPDFSHFDLDAYFMRETLPLSFNRGCVRRCVFCNIYESWKTYRHRSARSIFDEMRWQLARHPRTRHFEIDVAALNLNLKEIERLADLLIVEDVRVTWGGAAVFRPDNGRALLQKLARAGLKRLDIGFESGSPKILRRMKKGYIVEHAEQMLRDCFDAGVEVNLNVIVGFPGETEDDLRLTKEFLVRNRRHISHIGPPSELWVGNNNYIERHAEEFDIALGPMGHLWKSKDGSNDDSVRKARVREVVRCAAEAGISVIGYADAKARHAAECSA